MEGDRTVPKLRRFAGYDYTRGCTIFITFTLGRRVPVLSRVEGDRVVYLPAGEAFHATLLRELTRHPDLIRLKSFVIMPDHVHMRLYLTPGQASALRTLGQFVANLKRWSIYRAGQAGVTIDWQENYHDRICLTREIWERVDRYLMLSRLAAPGMTRSQAWHSLNAALGAQAQANGGLFLYIKSRADSASVC